MLITRHDVCMSKSCTLGHKCGLLPSGCTQNLRHNFPHKELLTIVNTFLKFFPLGFFFQFAVNIYGPWFILLKAGPVMSASLANQT